MISGQYVDRFKDANMVMPQGVSLNAPYEFHWLWIKSVEPTELVCTTRENGGREIRLPWKAGKRRDIAEVVIPDPIFGPQRFEGQAFKGKST